MSNPVPRLRRLLSIIPMIRRRDGISLQELQAVLGVSKRELQGDLNAIMLCGVPPYLPNDYISVFIDGDHVTVDYADHFARPARLTLPEALALRLAIARLQVPEEGPLGDATIELLDALDRLVLGADMRSLEGKIDASRAEDLDPVLAQLDEAVAGRHPLQMTYYSASSEVVKPRRLRPYGRGDRHGNQYVVGYCEINHDVRSFRVDRISKVEVVTGETFEAPAGFDLRKALSSIGPKPGEGAFHLRIRFDPELARFAAEDHSEMRVEKQKDGGVVVHMTCGSIPWAVSKCLLYGEKAEILEPAEARAALVGRLEAFLATEPLPT